MRRPGVKLAFVIAALEVAGNVIAGWVFAVSDTTRRLFIGGGLALVVIALGLSRTLETRRVRRAELRMPIPEANRRFVNRQSERALLKSGLPKWRTKTPEVLIIAGLAGAGKSDLTRRHVQDHSKQFDWWWWVDCNNAATDLAQAARSLHEDLDAPALAVRSHLEQTSKRWLLVLDDATDQDALREMLPQAGRGQVVVTTTDSDLRLRDLTPLELDAELDSPAAVEFLMNRANDRDRESAVALAAALGNLPLALEQVGAYVDSVYGATLSTYRTELAARAPELFAGPKPADYRRPVLEAWVPSLRAASQESAEAPALLACLAFVRASELPLEVLRRSNIISTAEVLGAALAGLRRFSLVRISEPRQTVQMHRLVQEVTRLRSSDQTGLRDAIRVGQEILTSGEFGKLLVHVDAITRHGAELIGLSNDLSRGWSTPENSIRRELTDLCLAAARSARENGLGAPYRALLERAIRLDIRCGFLLQEPAASRLPIPVPPQAEDAEVLVVDNDLSWISKMNDFSIAQMELGWVERAQQTLFLTQTTTSVPTRDDPDDPWLPGDLHRRADPVLKINFVASCTRIARAYARYPEFAGSSPPLFDYLTQNEELVSWGPAYFGDRTLYTAAVFNSGLALGLAGRIQEGRDRIAWALRAWQATGNTSLAKRAASALMRLGRKPG